MVSKVKILGKEENAREGRIKGNGIYQGRKMQGISGKEKEMGRTQETSWKEQGRKIEGRKERRTEAKTQWQQEEREGRKKRERKRE